MIGLAARNWIGETMPSLRSAEEWIAQAKGDLLVLLQEGDEGASPTGEWADHVYHAYELLTEAQQELDRARLYQ